MPAVGKLPLGALTSFGLDIAMNPCMPAAQAVPRHAANSRHASTTRTSRGFTLIEMLVSLAITMIMMGAVVSLFGLISDNVSGSRAIIEMSERLRATRNRLQADLQSARPPR